MAIPGIAELVAPTLRLIGDGIGFTPDIATRLAERLRLSEDDRAARLPNGQTVLGNRIAFVLRFAGPAGLTRMTAPRTYALTDQGLDLLKRPDAEVALAVMRGATPQGPAVASAARDQIQTEEQRLADAAQAARDALAGDVLDSVRALSPSGFEALLRALLSRLGYGTAELHRGGAGDEGVDGILRLDPLGLEKVLFQAKRYRAERAVTPAQVREFVGALTNAGATKGVLATTSSFTAAARDALPKGNSAARIVLIDGTALASLMIDHEVGVRTVQTIRIQRVDLDGYGAGAD